MRFGLNQALISRLTLHRSGEFDIHFDIGTWGTTFHVREDTDPRLIANLKYALRIEGQMTLHELRTAVWRGTDKLCVFLHYHEDIPKGKQRTFLHVPGTLSQGAVFDIYDDYLGYDNGEGGLIYISPKSQKESIIRRDAEYMKSAHIRPKGIVNFN